MTDLPVSSSIFCQSPATEGSAANRSTGGDSAKSPAIRLGYYDSSTAQPIAPPFVQFGKEIRPFAIDSGELFAR